MELVIIAGVAANGVIGKDGGLPWNLPEDLKHFKRTTRGHAVIMGRKTFESIGRPLPKRQNIIVSRTMAPGGYDVAGSLDEAVTIAKSRGHEKAFVIGGARLYAEALSRADTMILSELHDEHEGDVTFPAFGSEWRETGREAREAFDIVTYRRR